MVEDCLQITKVCLLSGDSVRKHKLIGIGKEGIRICITEKLKASTTRKKRELKIYVEFFEIKKGTEQTH